MDPDVAERSKRSIQEYVKRNSSMGGNRRSQGIKFERGQTSSTTTHYMFSEIRDHLSKLWIEEGSSSLYQALILCEMFDSSTSRSARVMTEYKDSLWNKSSV